MLPAATAKQFDNSPATAQQRASFEGKKKRDGFPFLTKQMLSTVRKQAKVLGVKAVPDNFKPEETMISVKLVLEGKTTLWSLRLNNPMLTLLQDAWGLDENNWIDKSFSLFLESDEHTGVSQIRVGDLQEVEAAPVSRSRKR